MWNFEVKTNPEFRYFFEYLFSEMSSFTNLKISHFSCYGKVHFLKPTYFMIPMRNVNIIKTRMTTFLSSKALWNYKKDLWKMKKKEKKKKNILNWQKSTIPFETYRHTCGPESDLRESTISDLESLSNFQVKEEKNIEIGPEIMKLWLY